MSHFSILRNTIYFWTVLFPLVVEAQNMWEVSLSVCSGTWQTVLHFGMTANASDHFDEGLDIMGPPPGFEPYACFYSESFPNFFIKDMRKNQDTISWKLQTTNCNGNTLILRWNLADFSAGAGNNAVLFISGYADMAKTDSLILDGDVSLKIYFIRQAASVTIPAYPIGQNHETISIYPNPFNGSVSFSVLNSTDDPVDVFIYNIAGNLISAAHSNVVSAGITSMKWDGLDSNGTRVPSGIYICRVRLPDQVYCARMLLLR